jgi:hypothetical protein
MDEVEVSAALRDWSLNWKEVTDTCKASMVTSSSRNLRTDSQKIKYMLSCRYEC